MGFQLCNVYASELTFVCAHTRINTYMHAWHACLWVSMRVCVCCVCENTSGGAVSKGIYKQLKGFKTFAQRLLKDFCKLPSERLFSLMQALMRW